MEAPTEQTLRLSRLLELPDFRACIIEWLESGFAPWAGPVTSDNASDASYVNGRASFINALMEEVHRYFPAQYAQMQKERFEYGRRSSTQLDGLADDEERGSARRR
jgi:hypothetical protein